MVSNAADVLTDRSCLKIAKCPNRTMSLRASAHTGVAIPPIFEQLRPKMGGYSYPGDCHTSDIGHWFAMTWYILAILTHRGS